ncbi:UNVERIFIED_CONTAM: hypothetical protein Sradi_2190600 [Sesamum radiatum]|uniref:Uncharacterized protein n=1 Tax=Sesamum radiatum TaxID=300843 RepID=A0AAW2T152_SESRA
MAQKEGGIVKNGHEEGLKMAISLLEEFELPKGLLPLADVIEVGFVRSTGYMWIQQKKKVEHNFKMISKLVSYDTQITGYVEKKRIKKLKGVKAKELMLWPPVSEIMLMIHLLARSTSRVLRASPRLSLSTHLLQASNETSGLSCYLGTSELHQVPNDVLSCHCFSSSIKFPQSKNNNAVLEANNYIRNLYIHGTDINHDKSHLFFYIIFRIFH